MVDKWLQAKADLNGKKHRKCWKVTAKLPFSNNKEQGNTPKAKSDNCQKHYQVLITFSICNWSHQKQKKFSDYTYIDYTAEAKWLAKTLTSLDTIFNL